eukprot:23138-Amphidinium_carterae.1
MSMIWALMSSRAGPSLMLVMTFSCAAIASCSDSCDGAVVSEGLSAPAVGPFDFPLRLLLPLPFPVPFSGCGFRAGLGTPHSRHVPLEAKLLFPQAQFQSSRE